MFVFPDIYEEPALDSGITCTYVILTDTKAVTVMNNITNAQSRTQSSAKSNDFDLAASKIKRQRGKSAEEGSQHVDNKLQQSWWEVGPKEHDHKCPLRGALLQRENYGLLEYFSTWPTKLNKVTLTPSKQHYLSFYATFIKCVVFGGVWEEILSVDIRLNTGADSECCTVVKWVLMCE